MKIKIQERLDLQDMIARLVLDDAAFLSFKRDRNAFFRRHRSSKFQRKILNNLSLKGLATFRDVIHGTREEVLRNCFSRLVKSMSPVRWKNLVRKFRQEHVLLSTQDDADLKAFYHFLLSELKGKHFLDLAKHDWALIDLGKNSGALLCAFYFSPNHWPKLSGMESKRPTAVCSYYLYASSPSGKVDIYELNRESYAYLGQLKQKSEARFLAQLRRQGVKV